MLSLVKSQVHCLAHIAGLLIEDDRFVVLGPVAILEILGGIELFVGAG